MSYKIIVDSCGELFDDMKADGRFQSVPLELEVDGYHVVDDASFDQLEFIHRVKESKHSPKSSCPSPQRYVEAYLGEEEHVYVVTLSGKLSGSYNSAELAKKLYFFFMSFTCKLLVFFKQKLTVNILHIFFNIFI